MADLKAKKRDTNLKCRKLRREGIVPGVLYGKNLDESISIQIDQRDAEQFMKKSSVGSRTELIIGRKKHMALLKEATYVPLSNNIEHLSFQALTAGEKVTSTAQVVLHNREDIEGIVQQSLDEISYKALPKDLVERIDVDVEGMVIGDSITVAELDFAKNEAVEILTPADNVVVSVSLAKEFVEEEEVEEGEEVEEVDAAEVPLVDEEESEEDSQES